MRLSQIKTHISIMKSEAASQNQSHSLLCLELPQNLTEQGQSGLQTTVWNL